MSAIKQSTTGFNDLNDQFNPKLPVANTAGKNNPTFQHNNLIGFRGLSRGSANRAATGQNTGNLPGTSNSQKRQTNAVANSNLNISLINRKINGSQQKNNIDFFPIQTTSYTSTGKALNPINQGMQKSSDFNDQDNTKDKNLPMKPTKVVGQGFSSLMASAANNKISIQGQNTTNSNFTANLPTDTINAAKINATSQLEYQMNNQNILLNGTTVPKTKAEIISPKNRNGALPYSKGTSENKNMNIQDGNGKNSDNIRKLSFAAKAGQMQLNSAIQDHQNQYSSSNNLIEQSQNQQIASNAAACSSVTSNGGLNPRSIAMTAGQNLIIPPPSNLGMHTRDSYMQMRQTKNINNNNKMLDSRTSNNGQITVINEVTDQYGGQNQNLPFIGLKNSGSQYQLSKHNHILFSNIVAQSQQMGLNSSMLLSKLNHPQSDTFANKTSSLGLQQQLVNKNNQMSPTHQYLNQRIQNSIDIKHDQMLGMNALAQQALSSKRRMNAFSYAADPMKNITQQSIARQANQKARVSDLNQQLQQPDSKNSNKLTGIQGKNIVIGQSQNETENTTIVHRPTQEISSSMLNSQTSHSSTKKPLGESTESKDSQPQQVNCKITRKLEGGRPHKVYDYMFIQMSNEQFKSDYDNKKIFVQKTIAQLEHEELERKKQLTQVKHKPGSIEQNLNGLVQIKAFDSAMTDELPLMQCNLLPTQLDHVKMLQCEQEDKNYPRLKPEAQSRFETEKQNQIKQYMEDIIIKLKQKERRFKVTVKRKFIDDALYNSTSIRVASVYVIVINREKAFDPLSSKPITTKYRKPIANVQKEDESSEEVDEFVKKQEQQVINNKETLRRSANPHLNQPSTVQNSFYESDNLPEKTETVINESNKALPTFKVPIIQEKPSEEKKPLAVTQKIKPVFIPPANFKNNAKTSKEEMNYYRYIAPVKEFKYKETRIKICQDNTPHDHYKKHAINIYFNQYNEFVKVIFKSMKQGQPIKFSQGYIQGLARVLGLNVKRDAFSDQNMKSRDHINSLREKLAFGLWRKLHDENQEEQNNQINDSSSDLDGGNSADSTMASSNTPKSKSIGLSIKTENESNNELVTKTKESNKDFTPTLVQLPPCQFQLPHQNVIYKYYIGKGNNSMMVRGLLKTRYWWVQGEASNEADNRSINFMWTQNKVQKIFENMQCKFPDKRSGNKHNEFEQLHTTPQQIKTKKKKQLQGSELKQQKNEDKTGLNQIKHSEVKLYNKIEDNFHVNNKKALYLNMKNYYEAMGQDVFDNLPLTFHIKTGFEDPEFKRFERFYNQIDEEIRTKKLKRKDNSNKEEIDSPAVSPNKKEAEEQTKTDMTPSTKTSEKYYKSQQGQRNIWIIKPGENTNRGHGIQVAKELEEIKEIIGESTANKKRTCILQKYIHNPLLINRRKFDIRTFALFTSQNGNCKVYLYEEGYLRTSCREYNINNLNNKLVHLTNDAVQKMSQDYGKFEPGNKLSINEFQLFLDKNYPDLNVCYARDILPQMNKLSIDVFRACHGKLDPKKRLHCMEVFGLDFMIDDEFRPYLIEVNTNPCLELSCPLLARLIPQMLENGLKIGMDSVFIPPEGYSSKKGFIGDACPENRYSLVYDSRHDGPQLDKLFQAQRDIIVEMDEDYSDDEDIHDDVE